jgi:hypothetical protein
MIDFEKIVTLLLQEHWEESSDFLLEAIAITDSSKGLYKIHIEPRLTSVPPGVTPTTGHTTKSIKDNMVSAYSSYGLTVNIPAQNILTAAIQTLQGNIRGTGKKAKDFIAIAEWFPILDLIAMLISQWPTLAGKTIEESQSTYETWEQHLEMNHGFAPALYKPLSPAGLVIARDLTNKTDVGTLRIKDLITKSPEISFFNLAKKLFEIRKQAKFNFLPKTIVQKFDLEGDKILNHIMYSPWELVRGTYPISKDLTEIYDHGIINMLVDLSIALYQLYKSELNKIVDYISNNSTPSMPDAELKTLNNFPKEVLNKVDYYKIFVGSEEPREAVPIDYIKWVSSATTLSVALSSGPLTDIPYFKISNQIENLNYLYNAENLVNASNGEYAEAKRVFEELEQVANYINTKEQGQKLVGATQIAKGLTLGAVPT